MICIENAKVVLTDGILFNGVVLVDNGIITAVGQAGEVEIPNHAQCIDAKGSYVGPGFVDIHVHGGGDAMFDENPAQAAQFFLKHGATTVLATLYTNLSKDDFIAATQRVRQVMQTPQGANIGGLYMEGPYMNAKFGASPEKNQWRGEIKEEVFTQLVDCAGDAAKVWAIAPEREGIANFMAYAKKVNPDVVFAMGHSEATPAQARRLKKYGLCLQTHCMDATGRCSDWLGTRGSGPDEACFLDSDMYAEMICDSMAVHVNKDLQRLILKNKGLEKVILISDSFVSNEEAPEDLKHVTDLSFDANRNLCGSRLTMDKVCRNIMMHTNCGIAQAFLMASTNPARMLGMDEEIGSVEVGKKANLVFVDDMFNIQKVMLHGKLQ